MSETHTYDFLDDDYCPECGGAGGYASCCEDCCPHVGGEEECDDPACWRVCPICRGKPFPQREAAA